MIDYLQYYNLETYLLGSVYANFHHDGYLLATDFFCIIIWKANRAKSLVANRLREHCADLDQAVRELTAEIFKASTAEERMRIVVDKWKFRLPMASAMLTILYPDEFTVYDVRVAGELDGKGSEFTSLGNRTNFESIWSGYVEFVSRVKAVAPDKLSLRDKDRWLWGKSFFDGLQKDIQSGFSD